MSWLLNNFGVPVDYRVLNIHVYRRKLQQVEDMPVKVEIIDNKAE